MKEIAYIEDIFRLGEIIEHEIKFRGNYGAKGEKRGSRVTPTPEEMEKINQKNRVKKVRRLIRLNFNETDYWLTLKYKAGYRQNKIEKIKKDMSQYLRRLRWHYKKREKPLKYIYRIEIGEHGGVHIHMILNRIRDTDMIVKRCWQFEQTAGVYYAHLYKEGGFERLAEYIVKKPDEETSKQLSLFPEEERKELIKYSCSRNLKQPVPERKEYSRRTLKKAILKGIKPTDGYIVDKSSVVHGINRFTGMSYLYYTEIKINAPPREEDNPFV